MSSKAPTHSYPDVLDELSGWLFGVGVLTLALGPLALPLIALTAIAVLPLLLLPLAAGLVLTVVAAPLVLARSLWRSSRARGARSASRLGGKVEPACR